MKIPFLNLKALHGPLRDQFLTAVEEVIQDDWFLLGGRVSEFERAYSEFSEVRQSVGVANGLDALKLSLQALDIGRGDAVIVPTHTFIASALAVDGVGAEVVLADVDERTGLLTAEACRAAYRPQVKAIMPVHLYGASCEMDGILRFAEERGLSVIEDASQAHGARYRGKVVGSLGDITGTSLYPGKNLGAFGDAGIVTTNSESLAQRVRMLANYGSLEKYHHLERGQNSRLDEIQGAVLSIKLRVLDEWNVARRKLAASYTDRLSAVREIKLPNYPDHLEPVWHLYVIRTEKRDELHDYLQGHGVQSQIHYPRAIHQHEAYRDLDYQDGDFPVAESFCRTCLSLPLYPGIPVDHVDCVIDLIETFFSIYE